MKQITKIKLLVTTVYTVTLLFLTLFFATTTYAQVGGPTEQSDIGDTGYVTGCTTNGCHDFYNSDTNQTVHVSYTAEGAEEFGESLADSRGHNEVTVYALVNVQTGEIEGYISVTTYVPPPQIPTSNEDTKHCVDSPDVIIEDHDKPGMLILRATDGMPVDPNTLLTGVPYRVATQIMNFSCWPTNGVAANSYSYDYQGRRAWYDDTHYVAIDPAFYGNGYVPPLGKGNTPYKNQLPYGENGTFPIRVTVDESVDGIIDSTLFTNQVGPLVGYLNNHDWNLHYVQESSILEKRLYPNRHFYRHPRTDGGIGEGYQSLNFGTLDRTSGTYMYSSWHGGLTSSSRWEKTLGYAVTTISPVIEFSEATFGRIRSSIDGGCSGDFGCLVGAAESDSLDFRVIGGASVALGSFVIGNNTVTDINQREQRVVTVGQEIGLYWTGTSVDFATCTGQVQTQNGTLGSDFSARADINGLTNNQLLLIPANQSRIDANITEPGGQYRIYTITCGVLGGGDTVSDSIILSSTTAVPSVVQLIPQVNNMSVTYPDTISTIPFRVHNAGTKSVTDFDYTITLDGSPYPTKQYIGNLPIATDSEIIYGSVLYQVPLRDVDSYQVPVRICVIHTDMTTEQCDTANITVTVPDVIVATECRDGIDNYDPEDVLADVNDPGCWTDPFDPNTYYPDDTSETNNINPSLVPDLVATIASINDCTLNTNTCTVTYRGTISNIGSDTPVGEGIPYVFQRRNRAGGNWSNVVSATNTNQIKQGRSVNVTFNDVVPAGQYEVRLRVNHSGAVINNDLTEQVFTNNSSGPEAFDVIQNNEPQCDDDVNNDTSEDSLVDENDPGCWTDPFDRTTYDPTDDSESVVVTPQISLEASPSLVRYSDTTNITYRIRAISPTSCTLRGGGIDAVITYPGAVSITEQLVGTRVSDPITAKQTFTLDCAGTKTTVGVEVIPLAQEI